MRLSWFRFGSPLLLVVLASGTNAEARQLGAVTGLNVTPTRAHTGATMTATVTGKNPCGAVLVDWGDGTAITHAIVDLPVTKTHAYAAAGRYNVTARAMGNCEGEVSQTVHIDAPPAGRAPVQLTGLTVASPGAIGTPVSMTLQGEGACVVSVGFGDGNTQELSVQLPHTFTHVYSVPRGYNVTASSVPPCEGGRHTVRLDVARQPVAPRISGMTVTPTGLGNATIQVAGSGTCSYMLAFGDGNTERRTVALPDRVQHVYPPAGSFVVVATAEPPCEGRVQDTFAVERPALAIDRLVISPSPALTRSRVSVRIEGRGSCAVTVDFGDGSEESIEAALPARIFHSFARPGRYEVVAWTDAPCTGTARALVQVRR